jgi:hypothetical protein
VNGKFPTKIFLSLNSMVLVVTRYCSTHTCGQDVLVTASGGEPAWERVTIIRFRIGTEVDAGSAQLIILDAMNYSNIVFLHFLDLQ